MTGLDGICVSIGLPVFNAENLIEQTLQSLQAQTHANWRAVISDNASTDGTRAICAAYAAEDDRLSLVTQDVNLGLTANFNAVFNASSGEYFMWLSADDLIHPKYLERCLRELCQNEELFGCYAQAEEIDHDGRLLGLFDDGAHPLRRESSRAHVRFKEALLESPALAAFAVMRRSELAKTPLLAPYVGSDRNLIAEIAVRGPVRKLPEAMFSRRNHVQQFSRKHHTNRDRYRSFAGRERRSPLWARRYVELARLVARAAPDRRTWFRCWLVLLGPYAAESLKVEASLLVRDVASRVGRFGVSIDYYSILRRRKDRKRSDRP